MLPSRAGSETWPVWNARPSHETCSFTSEIPTVFSEGSKPSQPFAAHLGATAHWGHQTSWSRRGGLAQAPTYTLFNTIISLHYLDIKPRSGSSGRWAVRVTPQTALQIQQPWFQGGLTSGNWESTLYNNSTTGNHPSTKGELKKKKAVVFPLSFVFLQWHDSKGDVTQMVNNEDT